MRGLCDKHKIQHINAGRDIKYSQHNHQQALLELSPLPRSINLLDLDRAVTLRDMMRPLRDDEREQSPLKLRGHLLDINGVRSERKVTSEHAHPPLRDDGAWCEFQKPMIARVIPEILGTFVLLCCVTTSAFSLLRRRIVASDNELGRAGPLAFDVVDVFDAGHLHLNDIASDLVDQIDIRMVGYLPLVRLFGCHVSP